MRKDGFTLRLQAYLLLDQVLNVYDGLAREDWLKNLLSRLGIFVLEKSKRGSVFSETMVQSRLFRPAITWIVDLMIDAWLREMQLFAIREVSKRVELTYLVWTNSHNIAYYC